MAMLPVRTMRQMRNDDRASGRQGWGMVLNKTCYLVVTGSVTAVFVWLLLSVVVAVARVEGPSMEPGLSDGDTAVFLRHCYGDGDVVLLYEDGQVLVKRILGVAGDSVAVRDGKLYRNGTELAEPYVQEDLEGESGAKMDVSVVPEGCVFVLGDNRGHSHDSRDAGFGFVSEKDIIGKLWFKIGK